MIPDLFPFPHRLHLRALSPVELAELGSKRQLYELEGPFRFASKTFGDVVVPAGFKTDFASIPRPVYSYISPEDPVILFASVIHDHLYTVKGKISETVELNRQQSDAVLREAMLVCGARPTQAWVVYNAVRLGGGSHWR